VIRALLELRAKLWWRRSGKAQLSLGIIGLLLGAFFSAALCALVWTTASELAARPKLLESRGGPLAVFATWLSMALAGRVWFSLIQIAQPNSLFDLRRFRVYPISPRLLSAVNFSALFIEPTWLVIYPILAVIAAGVSRMPGAPGLTPMLVAEVFAVFATGGVLHLGAALGGYFDARPKLRRGFSVALFIVGFAGFQLSIALPGRAGLASLFAAHRWRAIAWTPPGWTALLAQELSNGRPLHALTPAVLLLLLGLLCSVAAHELSSRDLLRPAEVARARSSEAHAAGWRLPFVPGTFSALFEKEAKTALRMGWLQLVLVPVAYLLLVRTLFSGPEPLLIAAVYAHLGVLELSTNAFGRDVGAARAYFLWPVRLRELLAAKNAVAYCFSLAIFGLLSCVALASAKVTLSQFFVGLLAHAATFPLLAAMGNALSVFAPSPVRGARLRRVRGAGPVGARLFALAMLAAAAWAPYAISQATGLNLVAAYVGEFLAMAIVYLASLGAASALLDARREPLLSALVKEE
jgi:ABC-2 type transport system permease protein